MNKSMPNSRWSAEEIAEMLRQYADGVGVPELTKKFGVSHTSFFRLKKRFSGMSTGEVTKSRQNQKSTQRLNKKIKEQELEIIALKAALKKKF